MLPFNPASAQQGFLVVGVQVAVFRQFQVAVGVPVVAEHLDRLFVELAPLAGQFLFAGQQGHDRQQHGVAGQKADGLRLPHAASHTFDSLLGLPRLLGEREGEPAADE